MNFFYKVFCFIIILTKNKQNKLQNIQKKKILFHFLSNRWYNNIEFLLRFVCFCEIIKIEKWWISKMYHQKSSFASMENFLQFKHTKIKQIEMEKDSRHREFKTGKTLSTKMRWFLKLKTSKSLATMYFLLLFTAKSDVPAFQSRGYKFFQKVLIRFSVYNILPKTVSHDICRPTPVTQSNNFKAIQVMMDDRIAMH